MTQGFDPKIPILMYHEISAEAPGRSQPHRMTPLYDLPIIMFEAQLQTLAEHNYTSLLFEDLPRLQEGSKYVMLTFDDGLQGNHRHALPLLKQYGFKAVFFINVGSVGSDRFMTWVELRELIKAGMSVQSHALSHRPLQTLSDEEVRKELFESKKILEKNLNTEVTAISFPHGSYDQSTARLARQAGYTYLFSSDVERICRSSIQTGQKVLGRIAMTNKLNNRQFIDIIEYKSTAMLRLKLEKALKNTLKNTIGIENYRRLYRKYFGIKK